MKSKKSISKESPKKQTNSKKQSIKERDKQLLKEKVKEKIEEEIPEEEKEKEIPNINIKKIERFIYISTYNDSNLMSILTKLFEEINQKAFNFQSKKEI